jgi:hypothetical protein
VVEDLEPAAEAFRYVDIESSDWCRALRLVKLIFAIRSALLVRRSVNYDHDEAVGKSGAEVMSRKAGAHPGPVLVREVCDSGHDHLTNTKQLIYSVSLRPDIVDKPLSLVGQF